MITVFRQGEKNLISKMMKEVQNLNVHDVVQRKRKYFFETTTQATNISAALATLKILYREGYPRCNLCDLFSKFTKADVDKAHHFMLYNDSMYKVTFYPNEFRLDYDFPQYSGGFSISYPDETYVLDVASYFFDYLLS